MNLLQIELARSIELFNTRILESDNIYAQSVLIELLIRLNFILKELNDAGKRVSFKDDVEDGDITDLVNNMRNAVCHSDSNRNKIGGGVLIYNKFVGYCPNAIRIGDTSLGCAYSDDTAFNFGSKIIYLNRHIRRLLEELPRLV